MASSVVGRLSCKPCSVKSAWKTSLRYASNAYYVLLPEIPPDTPDTNPLLKHENRLFPEFSEITADQCVTGCAKLSIDFETKLGNHIDKLKDQSYEKTFKSVFEPIEKDIAPLSNGWRTAKILNYVRQKDGFRDAFVRIHPQVLRAKNERWVSTDLYNAAKEVGADVENLTEFQQRLVDMYLLECRLNGINLQGSDKKRFIQTMKVLTMEKFNFRNRVILCQKPFTHIVFDFSKIQTMPKSVLAAISSDPFNITRGPWTVNLQHSVYHAFLNHCTDRPERWTVWNAYNNRAAVIHAPQHLTNHKVIEDIRTYRRDLAKLLGFENFAEMSMETRMAGSVKNVLNMIETFKGKFKPLAEEEIADLAYFAESNGFQNELQMWDVSYWRRRQEEHLFKLDDTEIAQYFPLDRVLPGLFSLCSKLFGITFKECTSEVDVWHEDVKFYNVHDENGDYLSSFFFDSTARPMEKFSGSWMEMARERSDLSGTNPYSCLIMNLTPPRLKNGPILMEFSDVERLFLEFGHGLQQMLTKVPYSELAGQRNIEWDAIHVCAKFLQLWLYVPNVLQSVSGHFETGETLPVDMMDRLLKAKKHMAGFDMMRMLYYSAYDMEVHISKNHWNPLMQQTWDKFMPVPLNEEDNHPCSLMEIFSDMQAASLYGHKWSEMIAADLFATFEEVGLDNEEKIKALGRRFRDTYLSLGGGVSASEVFRRFRGRDPSLDALQTYYGVR
ncbi:probable cytosolic oligopeptidase A [Gigantopelta aegis]|uniref:probable cytosolic oligopeptidase A n=1 Tax=Gigantopelta aegis TaxID=1735272 RepID=UPI001B88964A|nr:probable cytosolic oligopeptidase A [Gigantopelta aegis]